MSIMRLTVRVLLGLYFIKIATFSFAQDGQYIFKQINIESGLPGQNLRQVYQDFNGVIWLSVEAVGLCRYDGRNFELYSHSVSDDKSISSNYVNSIIEDQDSNLWIATEKGLNKYIRNQNSFKRYYSDSIQSTGLSSNLINTLFIDSHKKLWIGTGNGLLIYDNDSDYFEQIILQGSESNLSINTIFEHSSGVLFIGTNRGVIQLDPSTNKSVHWEQQSVFGNGPIHQIVRCFIEDMYGDLWIATHRGISKFYFKTKRFEEWKFLPKDKADFENEGFNYIYLKDTQTIWLASYTHGIISVNIETNKYQRISYDENTEHSLKSNNIKHIYKDKSGLLWVSTKFEGVFIYDRRKDMFNLIPSQYNIFQPLKNLHVLSFFNDSNKNEFWVGTKYKGLYKVDFTKNKITNYSHDINNPNSIKSNRVHEIFVDSKSNLWVGLESGLELFNEQNKQFIHFGNILVDDIIEDMHHNIWVGTEEGVFIVDRNNQRLVRYTGNIDSFFKNDAFQIMDFYKDENEQIWMASRNNGFFMFNIKNNQLTRYSTTQTQFNLRGDAIRIIIEDSKGNIVIGTKSDGLGVFNPKTNKFKYYSFENGLPSDFILSIQEDFNGNYWMGTHNGLSKFDTISKKFSNYNIVHGLQSNIYEHGTSGIFKDGCLIFGGHNGINIFNPNKISSNIINNDSVLITSVKINNKEIIRDVYKNTVIDLNYKQNYLTIDFVLSDYFDPLNHTFKYRMPEISESWHELGNKNYVAFSNLNPGFYRLQIMGTNEYGVLCKKPLELGIHIEPPLIKTWWFRTVLIAFLLIFIFSFVWYRIRSNHKIRKYLESEILERTEKIRKVNTALLGQNALIEKQKKEIEKNQMQLETKVIERTRDLEQAKLKAEEADRLKSSFLANMSHEIRTPLNSIIGFSSLIVESVEESEDFKVYGRTITDSSGMLLKIIDDILDISKIEAGQLEVQKTEVNINDMLIEVLNTFQEQLNLKNSAAKLLLNNPIEENFNLIIFTDLVRLKQIFFNLLSNAVKFTNSGFIEFGFEQDQNQSYEIIKFYVKDTGIGIKQKYLKDIFNRFVKVEVDDILYRGNGLGLSLCKSLVELLGGTIEVNSVEKEGSSFYFTIRSEKSFLIKV